MRKRIRVVFESKIFQKGSSAHVKYSFENPAENFPPKIWKFFFNFREKFQVYRSVQKNFHPKFPRHMRNAVLIEQPKTFFQTPVLSAARYTFDSFLEIETWKSSCF